MLAFQIDAIGKYMPTQFTYHSLCAAYLDRTTQRTSTLILKTQH